VFDVAADSYDRFMGRFSEPLAHTFVESVGIHAGQFALDVGCGPGALTAVLVEHLGAQSVSAVDPSPTFVAAIRDRFPGVDAQHAVAEQLPFDDESFDAVLAQLVVHFMSDPVAGLAEMRRVCRPGGEVAANVWDCGGSTGPLEPFWKCARRLDPEVDDESERAGVHEGQLADFFARAGFSSVREAALVVDVRHETFEEWWDPFTLGVGPAGQLVAALDADRHAQLRELCLDALGPGPFSTHAQAWTVYATA
jgi:SAM-dependent methyltransferase